MSLGTEKQRTEGIKRQADELIEQAYQRGFKAGKVAWEEKTKDFFVEQGRREAWEAAKKIVLPDIDGGMHHKVFHNIFGTHSTYEDVLKGISASEAIEKIKTYEEQKKIENEIKVGDEVVHCNNSKVKLIVTWVKNNYISGFNATGEFSDREASLWVKTGRYFPEIAEVLEKMRYGAE